MRYIYLLPFICFVLLSTSCLSVSVELDENVEERSRDVMLADMHSLMEEEEYVQVYALTQAFQQRGIFSESEMQPFVDNSLGSLQQSFTDAQREGDIANMERVYASLSTISEHANISINMTEREFIRIQRKHYIEQNNIPLLCLNLKEEDDLDYLSDTELQEYAEYCAGHHYTDLLTEMLAIMDARNIAYPESYHNPEEFLPERMIRGTVTIWVDKGTNIEQGIGYQDAALGAGFFIDYRGYILTNYHVIETEVDPEYDDYSRLYILTSDNPDQLVPAKVVSYDKMMDLALLKTEIKPAFVFPLQESSSTKVGDAVIALGSPIGLYNTATSGIISSLARDILPFGNVLQFDAAVYPGNSGGPLIDSAGRLIGVVFAGVGSVEGLNFAIPTAWVQDSLHKLYQEENVEHPWLGIAVVQEAGKLRTVYIAPHSPAALLLVQPNDVLLSINGVAISDLQGVQSLLAKLQTKSIISTHWQRGQDEYELFLMTASRPQNPIELALKFQPVDFILPPLFGVETDVIRRKRREVHLVITKVHAGSSADFSGYQINDELTVQGWELDKNTEHIFLTVLSRQRRDAFLERRLMLRLSLNRNVFL